MLPDNGRKVKQHNNLHMTLSEWKLIMQHVKSTQNLKWFVFLSLLSFRGMRPQEALAINVLDFSDDYRKLSWRECKTNKMRHREHIIEPLARLVKTYIVMNHYFECKNGFMFPFYTKKSQGRPYMTSKIASTWFIHNVRDKLKEKYPGFNERYVVSTKTGEQLRYRINLYAFRRFFETYIYLNNDFAPMSTALIKEIMEYGSKFDPLKHYIKIVHKEEQKASILENTFNPLAAEIMHGQKMLSEF